MTEFLRQNLPLAALFLTVWALWIFASSELLALRDALRRRGVRALAEDVDGAGVERTAGAVFSLQALLAISLFVVGALGLNLWFGLLLAGLGWKLPRIWLRQAQLKRRQLLTAQLVEGLALMGNGLRSGLTLQQSMDLLTREFPPPISKEFSVVLAENRLGVDLRDAIANMAARLKLPVVTILSTGVSVTLKCGGDLSEIFQHIAETSRARARIEGKIQAISSLGRFQASLLSAMPFLLMIALFFLDRDHVVILFDTKIGLLAVGTTVALVVLANVWIGWLLKLDV